MPTSRRPVSITKFRGGSNNFATIFPPNPKGAITVRAQRAQLRAAGFSFEKLRKAKPKEVAAVREAWIEYNAAQIALAKKFGIGKIGPEYVLGRIFRLPEKEKALAAAKFTAIQKRFRKSTEKPLYSLYCFLRSKGVPDKAMGLAFWEI
jgi:hypothetical protein